MQPAIFQLTTIDDRSTIVMPGTSLQVSIYHPNEEPFNPADDKVYIFGAYQGELFAFESPIDADQLTLAGEAISWYATNLGRTAMELLLEDPRPAPRLRLVR
jgi:hypothetical protein